MPYSSITGPFAYFSVLVDDLRLGRAYATEYVLPASLVEELSGREVPVTVKGVGFDGQELAIASTTLQF
jgi:ribosomal protein S9